MTVSDLEQWIDNDEGLYNWWRNERNDKGKRPTKHEFIRNNRTELEACINRVMSGTKPAHYLAYGG